MTVLGCLEIACGVLIPAATTEVVLVGAFLVVLGVHALIRSDVDRWDSDERTW